MRNPRHRATYLAPPNRRRHCHFPSRSRASPAHRTRSTHRPSNPRPTATAPNLPRSQTNPGRRTQAWSTDPSDRLQNSSHFRTRQNPVLLRFRRQRPLLRPAPHRSNLHRVLHHPNHRALHRQNLHRVLRQPNRRARHRSNYHRTRHRRAPSRHPRPAQHRRPTNRTHPGLTESSAHRCRQGRTGRRASRAPFPA